MSSFDDIDIDMDFPFPAELKNDESYAEQVGLRFKAMSLLPVDHDLTFVPSKEQQ